MFAMHAKEVTPQEAPELHGVIDRLCALADMPKPRVAIAQTDVPNAFATGRSPKAAVVCATTGTAAPTRRARDRGRPGPRDLPCGPPRRGHDDDRQRSGHDRRALDPGHVLLGDLRRRSRRGNNNNSGGQLVMIEMIVMLVSVVVYFVSFLLTMALSRYRELAADRSGRHPDRAALPAGRRRWSRSPARWAGSRPRTSGPPSRSTPSSSCRRWRQGARTSSGARAAGASASAASSARTPRLERRLAQLDQLEHELGQAH